jgi:hypothetical protein
MEDNGSPLVTIGQVASRTGLAFRTIRYWSDIGAVPPAGRSSGGHRLSGFIVQMIVAACKSACTR